MLDDIFADLINAIDNNDIKTKNYIIKYLNKLGMDTITIHVILRTIRNEQKQ